MRAISSLGEVGEEGAMKRRREEERERDTTTHIHAAHTPGDHPSLP
jgi:hypothetical protein